MPSTAAARAAYLDRRLAELYPSTPIPLNHTAPSSSLATAVAGGPALTAHGRLTWRSELLLVVDMRLSAEEQAVIREVIREADPEAAVYLFGSRADDSAAGGDIDLLILSRRLSLAEELRIKVRILDRIGWQKLDLVVARDAHSPLAAEAVAEGVRL